MDTVQARVTLLTKFTIVKNAPFFPVVIRRGLSAELRGNYEPWRNTRTSVEEVPSFPLRETVPWTRLLVLYGYLAEELERRPLYISIWISYDRVKSSWKWITNFEPNFLTILIGVESMLDMVKK